MELALCNRKTRPPRLSYRLSLVSVVALSNKHGYYRPNPSSGKFLRIWQRCIVGEEWHRSFLDSKFAKFMRYMEDLPDIYIANFFLPAQSLVYFEGKHAKVIHDMLMHRQRKCGSIVPKHSKPGTRKTLLVNTTLRALYPGKDLLPHCTGTWVDLGTSLDCTRNISPHMDSITGPLDP